MVRLVRFLYCPFPDYVATLPGHIVQDLCAIHKTVNRSDKIPMRLIVLRVILSILFGLELDPECSLNAIPISVNIR